jgi:hypothetical protein
MKCWDLLAGCVLALVVTWAAPVEAQWGEGAQRERPSAEEIAKRRTEARAKLFEELQLDSAQVKIADSLLTVRDDSRMAMMDQMRASSGDRQAMQDMREEMAALTTDIDAKISAVLTEKQRELFKAIREAEAKSRSDRRSRRGGF